jgi:hypothetical protein
MHTQDRSQNATQPASGARLLRNPSMADTGVPFTQYLLPDGRTRPQWIDRPAEIKALADRFIRAGGRYECEMLTTGEISFTAVHDEDDLPIAIEVGQNGPDVLAMVDRLVRRSVERLS